MGKYIVRRLLLIVPTAFIVSVLIFSVLHFLPGDVATTILAGQGDVEVDPKQVQELREKLGLNEPLYQQYGKWLWGLARLDGGESLTSGQPVFSEVSVALPVTLELTILSLLIALVIGLTTGTISALRRNTFWDYAMRLFAISGLAMPSFWTSAIIILLLVIFFQWLPPLGFAPFFDDPLRNLKQMMFPALVLGYAQGSLISRMTRSTMLEIIRQDYVRTAHAKGLAPGTVHVRHALRNALLPILTVTGVQFGHLLGGSVIVESIFVLPGLGSMLVDGVLSRDWVVVQTLVTIFAASVVVLNLLVDLLYSWLDPRIHYG